MGCHANHAFPLSPNRFIYGEFSFCIRWVPGNNLAKLSLECKVGQIRSWCSWFEAEISLFMMFVYKCFHLIYKAFINSLEYTNEIISYTTTI